MKLKLLVSAHIPLFISLFTWTRKRFCHCDPDLRKALPIFHGSEALALDMAVSCQIVHIHSGLHLLRCSLLPTVSDSETHYLGFILRLLNSHSLPTLVSAGGRLFVPACSTPK